MEVPVTSSPRKPINIAPKLADGTEQVGLHSTAVNGNTMSTNVIHIVKGKSPGPKRIRPRPLAVNSVGSSVKKVNSAGPARKPIKRPGKELNLEQRIALIKAHEIEGHSFRILSGKFGVSVGTVHNVLKRKFFYLDLYNDEVRNGKRPEIPYTPALVENNLHQWHQSLYSANIMLSKDDVRQKAIEISEQLGVKDFDPTDKWLANFSMKYNVTYYIPENAIHFQKSESIYEAGVHVASTDSDNPVAEGVDSDTLPLQNSQRTSMSDDTESTAMNCSSQFVKTSPLDLPGGLVVVKTEPINEDEYNNIFGEKGKSHQDCMEYDWQPPTEAERKVIQARRERSDRVSKIMGEYMLKGYTMLGSSCANCTTILLRDRNGSNYCVSCSDLESDTGKDDPALSSTAAERQIQENHSTSPSSTESSPAPPAQSAQVETSTRSPPTPRVTSGRAAGENRRQNGARSGGRQESAHAQQPIDFSTSRTLSQITQEIEGLPGQAASTAWRHESDSPLPTVSSSLIDIGDAIDIVQRKLKWACCELDHSQSVENCTRICQLIKVCAETMEALYRLQSRS